MTADEELRRAAEAVVDAADCYADGTIDWLRDALAARSELMSGSYPVVLDRLLDNLAARSEPHGKSTANDDRVSRSEPRAVAWSPANQAALRAARSEPDTTPRSELRADAASWAVALDDCERDLNNCLEREQNLVALIGSEPRAEGLREAVHNRSGALEYIKSNRTLVWTDRIGLREYGASAIVADHVLPWFGELIERELAATPPAEGLDVERLARALFAAGVGIYLDVDDASDAARDVAREYAALASEQPE
jgi:hypothetical protein